MTTLNTRLRAFARRGLRFEMWLCVLALLAGYYGPRLYHNGLPFEITREPRTVAAGTSRYSTPTAPRTRDIPPVIVDEPFFQKVIGGWVLTCDVGCRSYAPSLSRAEIEVLEMFSRKNHPATKYTGLWTITQQEVAAVLEAAR